MVSSLAWTRPAAMVRAVAVLFVALAMGCGGEDEPPAPEVVVSAFAPWAVADPCPVSGGRVSVPLVLGGPNGEPIGAEAGVQRAGRRRLGELVTAESVRFVTAPDDVAAGETAQAVATGPGGVRRPLGMEVVDVAYAPLAEVEEAKGERLVVIMIDGSGSFIGRDPVTGAVDFGRATDPQQHRSAFLSELLARLPRSDLVAVVPFRGERAVWSDEYSTPTPNRDLSREAITLATRSSEMEGPTPLAAALATVHARLVAPAVETMPVVVLVVTDGVEGGDASGVIGDEIDRYAHGGRAGAAVPVVVVHIQPAAGADPAWRGRSADLLALACRTGGAHVFVERATDLLRDDRQVGRVLGLVSHRWVVEVETTLADPGFAAGDWRVATALSVMGDDLSPSLPLGADEDGIDRRLWLRKE